MRARRRLIGALIAHTVLLTAVFGYAQQMKLSWGRLETPKLFWLMATFLITLGGGLVIGRRSFSSTTINRRLAASLIVTFVLVVLNRGLGVLAGLSAHTVVRADLLLSAGAAGAAAVLTERAWTPGALAMVLGAIAADVWPARADVLFSVAGVILLATLGRITPGPRGAPSDRPRSSAG